MKKSFLPKPISVICEVKLSYIQKPSFKDQPIIRSSKDAEAVLRPLFDGEITLREKFFVLCLNRSNRLIASYHVSTGGVSGTVADNKLIFTVALLTVASSIVIAHNHPSGNLTPSNTDEMLTKKIKEGASCLDLQLLDHLILSSDGYFSFSDEGLI